MIPPPPIYQTEVLEPTFVESKNPSILTFSSLDLQNSGSLAQSSIKDFFFTDTKINSHSTFVISPFRPSPQDLIEKFHKLHKSFIKESERRDVNSIISKTFFSIASKVAILDFEKGCIEITNDKTIKFTLLFSNNRILMISKPTNNEEIGINPTEVIFSYFDNRKLVVSNIIEINNLVTGFKQLLL